MLEVLEPPGWMASLGFDDDDVVPLLHGEVDRFGWMSLLGCRRAGLFWGTAATQMYRARHALTGVHLGSASESAFRRIELDVPSVAVLLGDRPIQPKSRPTSRTKVMRLRIDDRVHRWRGHGVDVEFSYWWTAQESGLGIDVHMVPHIEITSSKQRSFDYWFEEWLVPLSNFVHVATALPFRPRAIRLWQKKHLTRAERDTQSVSLWMAGIDPATAHGFPDLDPRYFRPVITDLRRLDIHDVVRRASRSRSHHEVFYDLLSSAMVTSDRPMTNRYLDVITALEAFDSSGRGRGPGDPDDFKRRRSSALAAVADPEAKRFLGRWTARLSNYTLEQRLTRLHALVGPDTLEHDTSVMAKLRNDIAHGNAHPDHYTLSACFGQALRMARRLALAEMGVDLTAPAGPATTSTHSTPSTPNALPKHSSTSAQWTHPRRQR